APPPQRPPYCLIDLVSILVTGAYSNVSSQTTSRQSHQNPLRAGIVPAPAPAPTVGLHRTARFGPRTAFRPKDGRQRQPPLALIPRLTVLTPNLG
ncbi:MAG: hypothetical protein OXH93_18200, partial [Caldilineaceae bacterium]|nr:hypothetical protein [Caldilineaceae bacterium]